MAGSALLALGRVLIRWTGHHVSWRGASIAFEQQLNHESGNWNQAATTRWGFAVEKELEANLLAHLREKGTPQKSQDIAKAVNKHVLVVEEHLDLLAKGEPGSIQTD
jgi:hypothetical protein